MVGSNVLVVAVPISVVTAPTFLHQLYLHQHACTDLGLSYINISREI